MTVCQPHLQAFYPQATLDFTLQPAIGVQSARMKIASRGARAQSCQIGQSRANPLSALNNEYHDSSSKAAARVDEVAD